MTCRVVLEFNGFTGYQTFNCAMCTPTVIPIVFRFGFDCRYLLFTDMYKCITTWAVMQYHIYM